MAQRLVVKKARSVNIKVMLNEMGPVTFFLSIDCIGHVAKGDCADQGLI